jgi:sarcosine oxidase gamma subunit
MVTDSVTTESLRKKFRNNFDLCNFAIGIGRSTIMGNPQATLQNILDAVDARASEAQVRVEDESK